MKCIFVIILITCFSVLKSQVPVQINLFDQNKNNIEHIIRSLEGPGVEILNITSNQKQFINQLCSFYDSTNSLGMAKGIILSTGSMRNILGKNSYTGMTGVTEQQPKTIIDTIQQYVPCIIKGKKPVLIYKFQKDEKIIIDEQMMMMMMMMMCKDSIVKYSIIVSGIGQEQFTSKKYINQDSIQEDVQMCMQTYIIPKSSNFTYNISNDPDLLKEVQTFSMRVLLKWILFLNQIFWFLGILRICMFSFQRCFCLFFKWTRYKWKTKLSNDKK